MDGLTRVEGWLKANCPKAYGDLREPASDEQLRLAETALSLTLPAEMVAIYRQHNGQKGRGAEIAGSWMFLSLESSVKQWQIQKGLLDKGTFATSKATARGPVRPTWWNAKWVPVFYDGAGNLQCIDLDPPDTGKIGQVVVYWHDRDVRECVAEGLPEWFDQLADELEAGKYAVEGGYLVRK